MTDTPKSKKKFIIAIIALVFIGLSIKHYIETHTFLYAGTLEATKIDLSARLSSVISDVKVKEGDHVKQGQELVNLSCDDLKVAANLVNENFDRTVRLFKSGTASKEMMDEIRNRKEDTEVRLGWCSISSPIDGTVLSRYHEPGEWVTPGTKVLTLANVKDIWAYIYVPQPDVARLKPGMKLKGVLPEMKNRGFEGTILKINSEAEFTPKNVQTRSERTRLVYGVKVSFLSVNDDEILKPGMTIEIQIPKE